MYTLKAPLTIYADESHTGPDQMGMILSAVFNYLFSKQMNKAIVIWGLLPSGGSSLELWGSKRWEPEYNVSRWIDMNMFSSIHRERSISDYVRFDSYSLENGKSIILMNVINPFIGPISYKGINYIYIPYRDEFTIEPVTIEQEKENGWKS
jgi:hypothetical protein